MSIPSQLPQFVTAARAGALQALALQSGQVLDARIIGPAANGATQVEIRGQVLNLVLPTLVAAGQTIKLEVQGAGPQLRLALQTSGPPPAQVQQAPATQISLTTPPALPPVPPQPGGTPAPASPAPSAPAPSAAALPQAPAAAQPAAAPATGTARPVPAQAGLVTQAAAPAIPPAQPATTSPAQPAASTAAAPPQAATPLPAGPYPAAPAPPNPFAAAAAATATAPAQPATPAAVAGAVRPVVATSVATNATAHSPPGNAPPSQPAPTQPASPQAALAQMVQISVPRQGPVTALTTALSGIAGRVVLPEPVARAAQQVLAGRVAIDAPRFDGTTLQAAVRASGVFQEANLARGQPLLQPDMKSALLTLRQTLTTWLGQQAPVAPVAQIPPPLRGSIPRARGLDAPPVDPNAAPEEVGRQLLERTESALARVRLHQHASLPDATGRTADLSLDLPVMIGTHQTLMQLQIHRDQHNEAETAAERGWQMRFALNLPGMGEVGAQVTLRGGAIGVMLWAAEPEASAALDAEIGTLRDALSNAGLQASAVIVRHGEPPAAPAAQSGHFVDSRT